LQPCYRACELQPISILGRNTHSTLRTPTKHLRPDLYCVCFSCNLRAGLLRPNSAAEKMKTRPLRMGIQSGELHQDRGGF